VVARRDDRRGDSQYVGAVAVLATVVADLDDVGLTNLVERVGQLVMLLPFFGADAVEEGVPDFRRELQRLAGLRLFEAVAHYNPTPRPEKSPYS
jgi:hypothetical protein